MEVIAIQHSQLGTRFHWTKSLRALEVDGDCLSVLKKHWGSAAGAANKLKKRDGMEFISKKDEQDAESVLFGRIK